MSQFPWPIVISLGAIVLALLANVATIAIVATRIEIKLNFLIKEIEAMKQQIAKLELRVGLLEQRFADWMMLAREWRKDEDERLGNHKRRIEALEAAVAKH